MEVTITVPISSRGIPTALDRISNAAVKLKTSQTESIPNFTGTFLSSQEEIDEANRERKRNSRRLRPNRGRAMTTADVVSTFPATGQSIFPSSSSRNSSNNSNNYN